MNYLDLFSGIGGFALGAQRAGFIFDKHYFSEIDKYAKKIYQKHFPEAVDLGGVQNVKEGLGEINLITFGFPCQDLSVAGKRAGLAGARSGLFFEATRLIRLYKPVTFIFENVEGLLTSNDGKDFEVVLREIADIGLYECEWQLLNTSWFLPQNRERVYFIGHLAERGGAKVFPIWKRIQSNFQEGNGENISGAIGTTNQSPRRGFNESTQLIFIGGVMGEKNKKWLEDNKDNSRNFPQGQRVYSPKGNSAQLTAHGGGWGAKTGLYMIQRARGFNKGGKRKLPTLTDQSYHQNNFLMGIRRLTPTECCRLQGFPDDWVDGISDSQKYKCLGNAVTVNVVEAIMRRILTLPAAREKG